MIDDTQQNTYAKAMENDLKIMISILDQNHLEEIEDWLTDRQIKITSFEVVDVSDVTLYHDTILTVVFSDENDVALFKLTWAR